MNDTCTFPGGIFKIKVFKDQAAFEAGTAEKEVEVHNKMTNASLAVISGLVGNTGAQTAFGYIGLGTSSTAVSAAHTGLQAEIVGSGLTRAASTNSRTTTTQTNDTLNFVKIFTATGSQSIEEIGIFNASSSGTMLARALTGTVSVANGNVITATYTWKVVGN